MTVEEIYERHIKGLSAKERLRLISLIAQGLSEEDPTVKWLGELVGICGRKQKRKRVSGGMRGSEFRPFILKALAQSDGRAREADVLARVEEMVKPYLSPVDLERLPRSNDYRWRKKACWERFVMRREGLLRGDSPRGIWELSESGWQEARKLIEGGT